MAELSNKPTPIVSTKPLLRLGVYGEGGAGKTTLALTFPQPLVVDLDGGLEGGAVDGATGDQWSPEKWQDLNALYAYLKGKVTSAESGKGYKTIIIDSIDTLCNFIRHEAENIPSQGRSANASENELITASQQDYGKVSTAIDIFLTKLLVLARERGLHIVITGAVREIDPEKGRLKRTFDCQPAVEKLLLQWLNVYGELVVTETKDKKEHRILWTKASDMQRKNKSRWDALRPGVTDPTFTKLVGLIETGTK